MSGTWGPYERSELQTERNEVFDDRQVLGHGPEGGWIRVGSAGERPEAERLRAKLRQLAAMGEADECKPVWDGLN